MVFLKSLGAKILAKKAAKTIQKWASNPIETQQKIFQNHENTYGSCLS